jgi:hypothetical protein
MQRHRQIAAAPLRKSSETWDAIGQIVVSTLEKSPHISGIDVAKAMDIAGAAGRILVAGGHLEKNAIVVVADPVYLRITTVSGVDATKLEEDLSPVLGGTTASDWTIYLPTPDPIGNAVRSVATGSSHLSTGSPPSETSTKSARSNDEDVLNLGALAHRRWEDQ